MDMQKAEKAIELAINSITPSLSKYGIGLERLSERVYYGRSEHVQMRIVLDWDNIELQIAPPGCADCFLNMHVIMQAIAPDIHFTSKSMRYPEEMTGELSRQLKILEQYGAAFLEGDFSRWDLVVKHHRRYQGPAPGQTREEWMDELRQYAADAFVSENYASARSAYLALRFNGAVLTKDEMVRYRKAARMADKAKRQ